MFITFLMPLSKNIREIIKSPSKINENMLTDVIPFLIIALKRSYDV